MNIRKVLLDQHRKKKKERKKKLPALSEYAKPDRELQKISDNRC
jgi:hypothetical protein